MSLRITRQRPGSPGARSTSTGAPNAFRDASAASKAVGVLAHWIVRLSTRSPPQCMLLPGREGEDELQSLQVSLQFFRTLFIVAHLLNLSEHQLVVFMSTHGVEGATAVARESTEMRSVTGFIV